MPFSTASVALIRSRVAFTDAEIANELNAVTVPKTDSTRWTWAGLSLRFGSDVVGGIDEVLKASPGFDWVRLLLAGGGIDFSSDATQAALESLRGTLGNESTDALKAVGRWSISPWANAGNVEPVTAEQVAEIRAVLVAEQSLAAVQAKVQTAINEVMNPMVAAGATWDQIKAAIAEVD